ncbi:unnamed protein product [Somion occarium]|uniref:Uncharacterized protein n=1 Tax=Somion occarium TaxID=3059160 RepID=A0ABP1D6M4_9APHY
MNPVLCIQELLTLIFRWTNDPDSQQYRSTLAKLAVVCKTFHDPALDELWHTQTDLLPTLLVLHGGAIQSRDAEKTEDGDQDQPARVLYQARPLSTEDIQRLRKYSLRVRVLEMRGNLDNPVLHSIDQSVVEALAVAANPLFPNLREFAWYPWSRYRGKKSFEPLFPLLLAPRVESVELRYDEQVVEEKMLKQLSATCSRLTSFVIHSDTSDELSRGLRESLANMKYLEELNVFHHLLDWFVWCTCASMPKLHTLVVELDPDDDSPDPILWTHMPQRSLPIQMLVLNTDDIQKAADFLTGATFPDLREISIDLFGSTGPPRERKVTRLFKAIVDSCPADKLDMIFINDNGQDPLWTIPEGRNRSDYEIRPPLVRPLFRFTNLRRLWLRGRWYWDLDDALVLEMCKAFPQLFALILDPGHRWSLKRRITLQGTLMFIEHAPKLRFFGATLDATDVPDAYSKKTVRPGGGKVQSAMEGMILNCSNIDSAVNTAVFLSDVFPNLFGVDGGPSYEAHFDIGTEWNLAYPDRWNDVSKMVRALSFVRQEERRWLKAEDINDPTRRAETSLARLQA